MFNIREPNAIASPLLGQEVVLEDDIPLPVKDKDPSLMIQWSLALCPKTHIGSCETQIPFTEVSPIVIVTFPTQMEEGTPV